MLPDCTPKKSCQASIFLILSGSLPNRGDNALNPANIPSIATNVIPVLYKLN